MNKSRRGVMPLRPFLDVYFFRIPKWTYQLCKLFWARNWFGLLKLRELRGAWGFDKNFGAVFEGLLWMLLIRKQKQLQTQRARRTQRNAEKNKSKDKCGGVLRAVNCDRGGLRGFCPTVIDGIAGDCDGSG
jgi:hypothetical protein